MRRTIAIGLLSLMITPAGCEQSTSSRATPAPDTAARTDQASTAAVTQVLQLRVTGMTCEGCAEQIRETLHGQPGIIGVSTDVEGKLVSVEYDPALTTHAEVSAKLLTKGYESEPMP